MTVKISDVRIYRVQDCYPNGNFLGFCSFVIDDKFLVGAVKILKDATAGSGIRLIYPTKINHEEGSYRLCFRPLDQDIKKAIDESVAEAFRNDQRGGSTPFLRWFRRHGGEKAKHYV